MRGSRGCATSMGDRARAWSGPGAARQTAPLDRSTGSLRKERRRCSRESTLSLWRFRLGLSIAIEAYY